VVPFEEERIVAVKERYQKSLKEFENVDETRFYQEMAYFTEKLDISEEKVRLAQHLKYYKEVMDHEDFNGKNLGLSPRKSAVRSIHWVLKPIMLPSRSWW